MINLFSHYVPGKLVILAVLEGVVLLVAAQIGISLPLAGSGPAVFAGGMAVPVVAALFALGMIVIMLSMGLYQWDLWSDTQSIRTRLVAAFLVGFALIALGVHVVPTLREGALTVGSAVVALALTGSLLLRAAFDRWNRVSAFKSRVLVLGTGSRVERLAEYSRHNLNHEVVGYVSPHAANHFVPPAQVLAVGHGESLLSLAHRHSVDQIVVAVRDRRGGGLPMQQLLECKVKGIKVVELPTFFEREYRQVMLESLNPSWMVLGDGFRQSLLGSAAKRAFDLIVSTLLLVLCLPILLVAALFIWLESGLPVLYRQERVGQGGRAFTLYKLRSMRQDAERHGGAQWAAANDDRTTRVGRFLRKSRIDELPQLINVLKGEMSFVGPRPERPVFVDQLIKQIPYYSLRHSVKPGISGWAQVRYAYGGSVDDAVEKLQYDLYYVKNHSLFMDIMILFATVEVVLWGKGAR
jgi:sugar transferase (PEP-CTERM system associated)